MSAAVYVTVDGQLVLADARGVIATNPRAHRIEDTAQSHTVFALTDSSSPHYLRSLPVALRAAQLQNTNFAPQQLAAALDRSPAQEAIRDTSDDDLLWRVRARAGIRADVTSIRQQLARLDATRDSIIEQVGIDLTRHNSETIGWLAARGVRAELNTDEEYPEVRIITDEALFRAAEAVHPELAAWRTAKATARDFAAYLPLSRHSKTGRFHPTIDVNSASTGRMAIRQPALQGVRKDVRHTLLADPGHVIVTADYKNAELRVATLFVQDPDFTGAVVNGDVYADIGAEVGLSRRDAKPHVIATLYGQSEQGLREKVSADLARRLRRAIFRRLPGMERWIGEMKALAKQAHQFSTAYGRPLPTTPNQPHKAPNYLVQGTARDAFGIGVRAVATILGADALWLPVHDELAVQVPTPDSERAVEVLRHAFSVTLPNGIRLPAEPKILGPSFLSP